MTLLNRLERIEMDIDNLDDSYRQYWKPKSNEEVRHMQEEAGEGFEHIWLIQPDKMCDVAKYDILDLQKDAKAGKIVEVL